MLYPFLFIFFTCIRRIIKYFLEEYFLNGVKTTFTQITIMIISSFVINLIFVLCNKKDKTKNKKSDINIINKIDLIQNKPEYKIPDNEYKIIILIIFAAFFEFFGFLSKRFITISNIDADNYDEFNAKFRGLEILGSSILCFLTLRIKIYRHHIFSLIIIVFCLIINFIIELNKSEEEEDFFLQILNVLGSSFSRAYLDTIEKYLFEVDYINMFNLILFEQFFNLIFGSLLYIYPKPRKQISEIFKLCDKNKADGVLSIIFLILYGILTAFKNIYRRFTVKQYSPMSRSLAESCIDPLLIIFEIIELDDDQGMDANFIVTLISTVIIIFCCCIYNEVIILYFCGLEHDTYFEISKRAKLTSDNYTRNSSINYHDINEKKTTNYNDNEKELIDKNDNENQN